MQFGYMPATGTTDTLLIVRRMQEKYKNKQRKLYTCSMDIEKAFDSFPGMKVIERIFEKGIQKFMELDEMHLRFMPGRGTINAIFITSQMMEKYEVAG